MKQIEISPSIPMSLINWEKTGDETDPQARLTAHIIIAGVKMFLEAWQVSYDENGSQYAVGQSWRSDDHDTLCAMMDCEFSTATIDEREYVLVATPTAR
jgi:hypothetical protein